ncbi:dTDP-glucose 4,6-dehydratase [Amycolatopsis sp. NPDC059090]|uniref:dTDP-glucose 4,6-dehydratase n=1 Tax=unclassified Amycolatopsis TaxID=2618356 RepID=UPI0036726357
MRLLVTGGAGFIGSHYVRTVLSGEFPGAEQSQVTVLDNLTYVRNVDNLPAEYPRLRFVKGDIRDPALLRKVLPGHDAVVHFAAESHVDRSVQGAGAFVRTNVLGTQMLLDACATTGVQRFVHVSTDEVYGSLGGGGRTETWSLAPNSSYAASEAGSDLIGRACWRTHGLSVSSTRCSNNYRPRQHPEKLIPLFVMNLTEDKKVPLYGEGRSVREWLHVSDYCRAIRLVLAKGLAGEVCNVGGGADRKGHDPRYAFDDTKIRSELGCEPLVPFERGLAEPVGRHRCDAAWSAPVKHLSGGS